MRRIFQLITLCFQLLYGSLAHAGAFSCLSPTAGVASIAPIAEAIKNSAPTIVNLEFEVGAALTTDSATLKSAVIGAEKCLNDAFAAAGDPKRINLNVRSQSHLSSQRESSIRPEIWDPPFDSNGKITGMPEKGYQANVYRLIISSRIQRSHVKPYYDGSTPAEKRKALNRIAAIATETDRFYNEQLKPIYDESDRSGGLGPKNPNREAYEKRYEQLSAAREAAENSLPEADEPNGNDIYLAPKNGAGSELARTIAHELMHAWGGLADRYNYSHAADREKMSKNLMGRDADCTLLPEQIEAIKRYRRNGEEERFIDPGAPTSR